MAYKGLVEMVAVEPQGLEFVRGQIDEAGPLAKMFLASLRGGTIWTFSPRDSMFAKSTNLAWSAFPDREGIEANRISCAKFIVAYLDSSEDRAALFEDRFREPGAAAERGRVFLEYKGTLYYPVHGRSAETPSLVTRAIKWSSNYPRLIFLTAGKLEEHMGGSIGDAQAQALVAATCHLLVGAFDDEGFVIWSRGGIPPSRP